MSQEQDSGRAGAKGNGHCQVLNGPDRDELVPNRNASRCEVANQRNSHHL